MQVNSRFWLIELIAFWEGEVSGRHLQECFGITRQQASKYMKAYRGKHPDNLEYSANRKRYVATTQFSPYYLRGDADEYLNWMTGIRGVSSSFVGLLNLPHAHVTPPPRQIAPEVMRPLVRAVREQRRIEVDYVSVSNPDRQGRIIAPHSFVNCGLRWHLRAYCEKNGTYRDFVLSRFRGKPELLDRSSNTIDKDTAWNTEVCIVLQADPRLSAPKRDALEQDYGMQNGRLTLKTRAALTQYLLQEMRVNIKILDGKPEAQQLVLVNYKELEPWLFNS